MKLRRVTLTGADDSIDSLELVKLSERFPFVEWGILVSKHNECTWRFPSFEWQRMLNVRYEQAGRSLHLSAHLCGRWVRELLRGNAGWFAEREAITPMFERLQLNFHAERGLKYDAGILASIMHKMPRQVIFQYDGINEQIMQAVREQGADAVPLFDRSGGRGVLPSAWPAPIEPYCGYAGGLSPDNVVDELQKIATVAGDVPFWIDAETHVRSNNDRQFDLDKVTAFLTAVAPFVE
jgi:hypothetical protein